MKCAQSFSSSISLKVNERMADARSIFGILLLSASLWMTVDVEATGLDEDAAISTMTSIFESGDAVYVDNTDSSAADIGDFG